MHRPASRNFTFQNPESRTDSLTYALCGAAYEVCPARRCI